MPYRIFDNLKLVGEIVFNRPAWWPFVVAALALLLVMMVYNYASHRLLGRPASWIAMGLKTLGFALIAICLLEPMNSFEWPHPQENVVGVLLDASKSMNVGMPDSALAAARQNTLGSEAAWQRRVAQDFAVRRYAFASGAKATEDLSAVAFDGQQSNMVQAMELFEQRMQRQPIAAMFVFTDGNATDIAQLDSLLAKHEQPDGKPYRIYPVLLREETDLIDLAISQITVDVANFETSPINLDIRLHGQGIRSNAVQLQVYNDTGKVVAEQKCEMPKDRDDHRVQVQFRSSNAGVQRYKVTARLANDAATLSDGVTRETTLDNNSRFVIADRGSGPYRILYIAGRPNWEFKFMRRALAMDSEMELVGMVRIAKREAKFTFQGNKVGDTNSLFEGFEADPDGLAEQVDEAVFTRLGVKDETELKAGFPTTESELYGYHMVVIDDLESQFFSPAQQQLLRRFVSQRGGTLLMLGGSESFRGRDFASSTFAQMLPFYFKAEKAAANGLRFNLTREGWLQPSLRLKGTTEEEQVRIERMPVFQSANLPDGVKPGAIVYVNGTDAHGSESALLASQRFGQGRVAAMLLTDFWRWAMHDPQKERGEEGTFSASKPNENLPNEALVAWRQMCRWLITDVPRKFDIRMTKGASGTDSNFGSNIASVAEVLVRDAEFQPLDNATVNVQIENPDSTKIELTTRPDEQTAGSFVAETYPTEDGAYLVNATGTNAEGEPLGHATTGLVVNLSADEYANLQPNRQLLEQIASRSGGEVLTQGQLERVAERLPFMKVSETIRRVEPMWHQALVLSIAFALLMSEWGLRRWRGLP